MCICHGHQDRSTEEDQVWNIILKCQKIVIVQKRFFNLHYLHTHTKGVKEQERIFHVSLDTLMIKENQKDRDKKKYSQNSWFNYRIWFIALHVWQNNMIIHICFHECEMLPRIDI